MSTQADTTPPLDGWTVDLPHADREALHAGPDGRVWWSQARGFEVEADARDER